MELLDRFSVLKPKKALIINNLITHHPDILHKFKVKTETTSLLVNSNSYIVMPFYKALSRLGNLTIEFIRKEGEKSSHLEHKGILRELKIYTSYTKVSSINMYLRNCNDSRQKQAHS